LALPAVALRYPSGALRTEGDEGAIALAWIIHDLWEMSVIPVKTGI
jgi:hypothetical protein